MRVALSSRRTSLSVHIYAGGHFKCKVCEFVSLVGNFGKWLVTFLFFFLHQAPEQSHRGCRCDCTRRRLDGDEVSQQTCVCAMPLLRARTHCLFSCIVVVAFARWSRPNHNASRTLPCRCCGLWNTESCHNILACVVSTDAWAWLCVVFVFRDRGM